MTNDPSPRKWTEQQQEAMTRVDRDLLVSAAAGSGKTTVLAERCVNLVCDPRQPCDVDELLVVTFTEAAAAQMKTRIAQSLRARAATKPGPELLRQLALIDHAQVSTLHGFCAKLLRQHFHLAQVDPNFRILDGDEAGLLRREIARQMLRESYGEAAVSFERFVDAYAEGEDERLVKLIVSTHEMLCSLIDPNGWIHAARNRLSQAASLPLCDSELGGALNEWIGRGLEILARQCDAALKQLRQLRFPDYEQYIRQNVAPVIAHWRKEFASEGIDALCELTEVPFPKLPPVPEGAPGKELAQGAVRALTGAMKHGPWGKAVRFNTAQWQQGMEATLPHAKTFFDLVGQFARRYRIAKDSARALDFADLERMSLKVLSGKGEPSATARAYHQRFRHVLVDEYQDINELQDEILSLVSHERSSDPRLKPNTFYVGDVKQSIYRFRLAEPARFLKREENLRGGGERGQVIDLQANFRSRKPLLDAINQVFERLMTAEAADIEYDQSHRLVAEKRFPDPVPLGFIGAPIELHVLPQGVSAEQSQDSSPAAELDRTEREAMFVAQRIHQLMGLAPGSQPMLVVGEGALRPIQFGDIVILLRSMRHKSEQFARILQANRIPVHADSVTGYFESMEVCDVLALLHVLDNRQQDIPLATVLRSPLGRFPNPDDAMARIRLAYPPTEEGDVPFHQAVTRYACEKKDELAAHLRDVLADLRRWRHAARCRPLDELLWAIYQESGYLAYCQGLSNGEQRAANLMLMHEKATQFGTFQQQGLSRFLEFLESLRDEADIGLPSTASQAQKVVRIMSIHRSKGLEFPVVLLPDLGKRINVQDCQGAILTDRMMGLGLRVVDEQRRVRYPSLASAVLRNRIKQQVMAEELRVLYVAMTRAQEHLIMLGTAAEKTVEHWRLRWSSHTGPLPMEQILGAATMLDWIGPVAAATKGVFALTRHTAEQLGAAKQKGVGADESTPRRTRLANLQPLPSPPPMTENARHIIDRLEVVYPFAALTLLPAVQSVTGYAQPAESEQPATAHSGGLEKVLERPRFLAEQAGLSPTERGTVTHRVLQHLDFRRACDADDIAAQIEVMIERRSLSRAEAKEVNQSAIEWFITDPVGQLLRQHAGRVRREIPVYFTLDDSQIDPADRRMIRGRLDLLLPLDDGHVIVDYKTDAVDKSSAMSRAEGYRNQMELYRNAIQRITRQSVQKIHLVFLTAQCVVTT